MNPDDPGGVENASVVVCLVASALLVVAVAAACLSCSTLGGRSASVDAFGVKASTRGPWVPDPAPTTVVLSCAPGVVEVRVVEAGVEVGP